MTFWKICLWKIRCDPLVFIHFDVTLATNFSDRFFFFTWKILFLKMEKKYFGNLVFLAHISVSLFVLIKFCLILALSWRFSWSHSPIMTQLTTSEYDVNNSSCEPQTKNLWKCYLSSRLYRPNFYSCDVIEATDRFKVQTLFNRSDPEMPGNAT